MADIEEVIDLEHLQDKRDTTIGDKNCPKDSRSNVDGCDPPLGPPTSRQKRRLLHPFCLVKEVADPKTYGRGLRWAITVLVAAAAAIDSTSTNIFYSMSMSSAITGWATIDRFPSCASRAPW